VQAFLPTCETGACDQLRLGIECEMKDYIITKKCNVSKNMVPRSLCAMCIYPHTNIIEKTNFYVNTFYFLYKGLVIDRSYNLFSGKKN